MGLPQRRQFVQMAHTRMVGNNDWNQTACHISHSIHIQIYIQLTIYIASHYFTMCTSPPIASTPLHPHLPHCLDHIVHGEVLGFSIRVESARHFDLHGDCDAAIIDHKRILQWEKGEKGVGRGRLNE